jgi:hypothetical protein
VVISGGYRIVLYNHAVFELDHFQKRFVKLRLCCMLHAAPGSQNGMEHSVSRDGSVDCASVEYITNTGSY